MKTHAGSWLSRLFFLGALLLCGSLAAQTIPATAYSHLQYRLIGPMDGGRVLAVAGVATQPGTYYFGSANGGVWKTTNSGLTWTPVFDHELVQSIGAIAVAPSNPDVVYVGTGEADPRSDVTFGNGVYKSTDAGATWTHIGLDNMRHIGKIVVDPKNPDIVMVAALGNIYSPSEDRGIYRSTDGGKTWEKVLYVNDQTGGIDLAMDPANPKIVYAGMWHVYRKPWYMSSGGPGDGLFKSTDEGKTWTRLTGHGLPTGVLGKIGVAVAGGDAHGKVVYALIEAQDGGLYRSDNSGQDWKLVSNSQDIRTRAWYFTNIFADPGDANTLYVADNAFYKSSDGGHTWSSVAIPGGDNHALWINPLNPKLMIQGHDQGVVTTVDGGKTWGKYYNLPIAQIYHIAADDRFPYNIYGSDQDCPSGCAFGMASRGADGITSKDVYSIGGEDGESGYVAVDPNDENYVVEGGYDGALTRYSHRTQTLQDIAPWSNANGGHPASDQKYRFTWTSPFAFAPWAGHPLYMGSQYLMVSYNSGKSWQVISKDLTRDDKSKQQLSGGPITKDNASVEYYDVIYAIAPSYIKAGEIWIGTDDGLVWLTRDGGKTYRNITPKGMPEWSRVDTIEPSRFDAATAYMAVDAHKLGNDKPYIYVTHDYGAHWKLIDDGLSAPGYVYVVRQDTVNQNLLFAGTANGIYVSFDGGAHWQSLQLNLPRAQVRDLLIKGASLIVATHGRSVWSLDDISPLRQLSAGVLQAKAYLFKPEDGLILRMGGGFRVAGNRAGTNPPDDAIFYYLHERQVAGAVKLSIYDARGNLVNQFTNIAPPASAPSMFAFMRHGGADTSLSDEPGINRFVWNLRFPAAPPIHATVGYDEGRGPNGIYVVPGTYKIVLSVGGQTYQQMLTVKNDPRSTATQADLVKQFNLGMQTQNLLWQDHAAANQVLGVRRQFADLLQKSGATGLPSALRSAIEAADAQATAVQGDLYQYKAETDEELLNFPIQLGERLSYLSNEINLPSANAPTQQFYAEYAEYAGQMAVVLKRWQSFKDQDLKSLNGQLRATGLSEVTVPNGPEERMPSAPVQLPVPASAGVALPF